MPLFYLLILLFSSCQAVKAPPQLLPANQEINIIVVTDIHYLDSELLEPYSSLHRALTMGDGKITHYSPEIVSAFVDEVIRIKPHALVLAGDISFNGEKKSHIGLAQKLQEVKNAGIPVLVVPGNHDINSRGTYLYSNDGPKPVPNVSKEEFWSIYSPLGAVHAVSMDKNSLSYVYQISEDLQIMMLDTCQYERGRVRSDGIIGEKTLVWMEDNLKKAKDAGITVISVMHHNLLPHSSLFRFGFTIDNYPQAVRIMEQYGVPLNFSGHMHIQHIARSGEYSGMYDIAANALTVFPNYYGTLTIGPDKSMFYKAKKVNVSAWAANAGVTDQNLLRFDEYAYAFMNQTIFHRMNERMANAEISDEQRAVMIEFAQMLNTNYFAGSPSETNEENEKIYDLWKEHFPNFFTRYFDSILKDNTQSTQLFIPARGL